VKCAVRLPSVSSVGSAPRLISLEMPNVSIETGGIWKEGMWVFSSRGKTFSTKQANGRSLICTHQSQVEEGIMIRK
jgi:hypothetical protein